MKSRPIKILGVTEYFPPHWTGISKAFLFLMNNLKDQRYAVSVLTTQFDTSIPKDEEIEGIPVHRSPYQFRLSRTHYSILILWDFLKRVPHVDKVIINSPNSNILGFAILTKLFRKELAIFHQGDLTLPRMTGNQMFHRIMEKIFDLLTIPSFLLSDIASTYTRDYAENSRVMKYSLYKFRAYVPAFTLSKNKPSSAFKKKIDTLGKKHTLIGFAGRFVEEKAYDVLMDAIPLVIKDVPDAQFLFAGKEIIDYEPYFDQIADKVTSQKKHITFLGLLDEADLTYFYEKIQLFVISSRSDCFPTTQIEVVQKKVPIVVTDIPGARMLVKSTGFGEIAQTENPKDLAKKIIRVIKDPSNYTKKHANVLKFMKTYEDYPFD